MVEVMGEGWWVTGVHALPKNHIAVPYHSATADPTNCVKFTKGQELDDVGTWGYERLWIGHLSRQEPTICIASADDRFEFYKRYGSSSIPMPSKSAIVVKPEPLVRWHDVFRAARAVVDLEHNTVVTWDTSTVFDVQHVIKIEEWVDGDPDNWWNGNDARRAIINYFDDLHTRASAA